MNAIKSGTLLSPSAGSLSNCNYVNEIKGLILKYY